MPIVEVASLDILLKLGDMILKEVNASMKGGDKKRVKQRKEMARYVCDLGNTLSDLARQLKAASKPEDIPTEVGNKFEEMVKNFSEVMKPLIEAELKGSKVSTWTQQQKALDELVRHAKDIDWHLVIYQPFVEQNRNVWIIEMERVAGRLKVACMTSQQNLNVDDRRMSGTVKGALIGALGAIVVALIALLGANCKGTMNDRNTLFRRFASDGLLDETRAHTFFINSDSASRVLPQLQYDARQYFGDSVSTLFDAYVAALPTLSVTGDHGKWYRARDALWKAMRDNSGNCLCR